MRIDAFTHIVPTVYRAELASRGIDHELSDAWRRSEPLINPLLRIEIMDETEIDLQVLTLATPPPDHLAQTDEDASALCQVANDGIADIVRDHPGRFIGVGTVALGDVDGAIAEAERCVSDLGLRGIQLFSNVKGRPIDDPALSPFYSYIETLEIPLWLHPFRPQSWPDYPTETASAHRIWFSLGWPIDTTVAMARLVLSGMLEKHPGLNLIVHHAGALIPSLAPRIATSYREAPGTEAAVLERFARFYVDTVVTRGGGSALSRAIDLFSIEHVVFGSDFPFGAEQGREFIRYAKQAVADLGLSEQERRLVESENILSLIGPRSLPPDVGSL